MAGRPRRKRTVQGGTDGTDARARPGVAANGQPIGATGRYVHCPGGGVTHPPIYVEVHQGRKVQHTKCPLKNCGLRMLMNGPGWEGVGITREEAIKRNPTAMVLS